MSPGPQAETAAHPSTASSGELGKGPGIGGDETESALAMVGDSTVVSTPSSSASSSSHRPIAIGCRHLLTRKPESEGEAGTSEQGTTPAHFSTLLSRYKAAIRWGVRVVRGMRTGAGHWAEDGTPLSNKDGKLPHPACMTPKCGKTLQRPFLCLTCAFTACWKGGHIGEHLADDHDGLGFAVDMTTGALFCSACDDIVYDARFERALRKELEASLTSATNGRRTPPEENAGGDKDKGKKRSAEEDPDKLFAVNDSALSCRAPRGLRNLGNTCYLNVIIQSFLHNPPLRNFFLGDGHNPELCGVSGCVACEMDRVVSEASGEFYARTNESKPAPLAFAPTTFLYSMWTAREASELSTGYAQHDAHELFISALDAMHSGFERSGHRIPGIRPRARRRSESSGTANGNGDSDDPRPLSRAETPPNLCPCPVHATFCGQLQSDVRCGRCGNVTSVRDPLLDISLDVRPEKKGADGKDEGAVEAKKGKKKSKDVKKDAKEAGGDGGTSEEGTLMGCLMRYTSPEALSTKAYACAKCGTNSAQATKQLSLRKLPMVLSIQLKRFEHTTSSVKIDTRVRFPLRLDMRPFCTPWVREDRSRTGGGGSNGVGVEEDDGSDATAGYVYDLFSVVVHEGSMNTGHYTNFTKWKDEWYCFDDDKVTRASLSDVLSCKAYQLFYQRRGATAISAPTA